MTLLMTLLLLAACGGPITGTWTGDCGLTAGDRTQELALTLYVDEDHGAAFAGSADIDGHDFQYTLDGQYTDTTVDFALVGTLPDEPDSAVAHVEFSGDFEPGAHMEGPGEYWVAIESDAGSGESDHFVGDCTLDSY